MTIGRKSNLFYWRLLISLIHKIMLRNMMEILKYTLIEIGNIKITVASLVSLLVIFLIARLFIWSLKKLLDRRLASNAVDTKGKKYAVLQIAKYIIYTIALLFMIQSIGVDLGILVTGSPHFLSV